MSDITVDFAQYTTDTTLNGPYNAGDNVTLADDSSILDAFSDSDIDGLATNNVDVISATDGVLSWTADQYSHLILGPVTIDPDTFAIMSDTGADIAALSAVQIAAIAAEGVAAIDPSDSMLNFTVAQFDALGAMSVDASADFTIADIGANLASMDAGQIASLASLGVDHLDATDNVLALSVAQYQALGTVTLTAGDDVTLADNSANLETLTSTDFGNLGANGIDHIDATDNVLTINLADFNALGSVTLTRSDVVTLADTGATISGFTTGEIDTLATGGIDVFDATDNAITFSVAQYNETVTDNIALTAGDTVTLADAGATLAAQSAAYFSGLVNVDVIDATDNALTLRVDQFNAIEGNSIALTAGDTVTLSDTATNLATLDFSTLAAANVDQLDATTAYTTLTVAQLTALGTVVFTGASSVTLTDTGAAIAGVSDFSVFAAHGVDTLDASDNLLTISEAQFQALGTTTLTGSDTVTISDTAANIVGGPNYGTLAAAGIDFLNATTAINVTVNDITNLGAVVFTSGSAVTLSDTGAHIAAVANFTTFGTHGVDTIDSSNNTLTMNATQFGELGSVTLTAADTVTISDSAAHLSGLTFSTLAGKNVDLLNSTNAYTNLTVQNVTDLGAVHFTAASNVTLTDTAAHIQAVSDFTTFATHGVDTIKSSDNALSLTVSQFSGLGTTHLTGADAVTLADTATNLNTYLDTAGTQTTLSTNGVDIIHATGGSISVDVTAFNAVHGAGAVFASGDAVTLADTGTAIAALDFTTLASTGIDTLDATNNALTVTAAQYLDVAGIVAFTAGDTVTIADTAANIGALTAVQIGALGTNLIDDLSVTSGGDLDWSVAQWQALSGSVSVSDTGHSLVVADSEADIEALTGTQLGALATSGAQHLTATEGTLNFSVSQTEGFLGTSLSATGTVTLVDAGATIATLTATQIGELAGAGFSTINASDDTLSLSVAQFSALGTVHLTGADAVTLADTAANLNTYLDAAGTQTALSTNGVDTIHTTGGSISVDVAAFSAVHGAGAVFLAGDSVTLADTGAAIAALDFTTLASTGIDVLDASDNTLNVTVAQYLDVAGNVAFTAADTVTIADTAAHIEALTAGEDSEIGGLAFYFVDAISVTTGGDLDWSVAQWQALPESVSISDAGGTLVVSDSEANIEALSGTDLSALAASGAQQLTAAEGTLNFTVSQAEGFLATGLSATGTVTLVDSAANIEAMTPTQIGELATAGFDTIHSTDNALTIDAAQFEALGSVALTNADDVTITDTASNIDSFLDGANASTELFDNGVNTIHATGGTLSVTVSELNQVLGTGTVFESTDTVTVADTGAHIESLNFSSLAGANVDALDASNNVLSITLGQYEDIAGVVALTAGDSVTVTGSLDNLSTTEIAGFGTNQVDHLLDTDSEVLWNVAQWNALATTVTIDNSAHIATLNFVFDSAANLSAVTATQVANFVAEGAETWEELPAGNDALVTWTVANTQAMGGSTFSGNSHVTVVDSAATIQAVSDFTIFAAHGIDTLDSTDDTLTVTVAQYSGLGTTTLTGADAVTIADTATNLNAYFAGFASAAALSSALSANGIDTIHATDGSLSVTAKAFAGVQASGAVFLSGDTVTLADTGAAIAALDFTTLAGSGVDIIDATDNTLTLTLDQYNEFFGAGVVLTAADDVTVTGSASNIEAISAGNIATLDDNLIDHLVVTSGGDLDWSVDQWQALPGSVSVALGAGDNTAALVVFDAQATIQGLAHADFAAFVTQGATEIASSNGVLNLTVDQVTGFLGTTLSAALGDTVTISDTEAHIEALTATQIGELAGSHIDHLFATDGSITFNVAKFDALGTVTVAAGNTFTVSDTEANIEAMGTDGYTAMAGAGVDFIHSTTGSLTVTFAELGAIYSSTTVFIGADTVTLTASQAEIFDGETASYLGTLGAKGIDEISLTGTGIGHLAVDQWNALVTGGTTLDEDNVITLLDTAANLSAETPTDIEGMDDVIDHWQVSDGQTAVLSKAQLDALIDVSITFTPTSAVILFSDTEATVEGLTATQLESYITEGVNAFRASDTSTLNLSASQVTAVVDNGAYFVPANSVTLSDTAAAIGALTATQFGELVTGFVDAVTATGGTLQISVADFEAIKTALHSGALTLTNAAELSDTGTAISSLTTTEIGQLSGDNITAVSATGDVSWTQAQVAAASGVTVSSTGHVILADTEANIEALTTAQIDSDAATGVNQIHSTDVSSALNFTATQAQHILSDGISVNNTTVTVTDTGAHLSTLSFAQLNGMDTAGFTGIVDTSGTITWSLSQLNHLTVPLTLNGNGLTLSDTEATLEAQNGTEWTYIASLATNITASNTGILNLSYSQISPLFGSGATFATANTVTLTDTSTVLDALTATQIGELAGLNVDAINASDDSITWNIAQFGALGTVALTAGDNVTLADSSTNLETLNFGALAGAGVDHLDATDNMLTINVAQFNALGAVTLTAGDTVTISDTAADITTLSFSTLAGKNVDVLDVTDGFSLSVARYQQMGAVKFAAADNIVLLDTGAHITALTAVQIGALAGNGIDRIDASDNALSLSVAQYNALGAVALTGADTVTLADTGAALATLNFATLAANGVDVLDATNNILSLTVAQYGALGSVALTQADVVTLADTGANIAALTSTQIGALQAAGIDKIDATNNVLTLNVAQFSALGAVTLTGSDNVTLLDIGANLETLNFSTLASKGIDILDASDNVLALTAAQFQSLGTVALKSTDTVTLLDTGADISALTVGQFNALAAKGIDILDATDNAYSLIVNKVNGLGNLSLAANDTVTVQDSESQIESMTALQLASAIAKGVDIFHANDSTDNMSVAQITQFLGTTSFFAAGDTVTLTDTAANIQGLSATQFGQLAAAGVDRISSTSGGITVSLAQLEALGTVTIASAGNTLSGNFLDFLGMPLADFALLTPNHITSIYDSQGGPKGLEWSLAKWEALPSGIAVSAANNLVVLHDDAGTVDSVTVSQINSFAAAGLDRLEAQSGAMTFNAAQTAAILSNNISLFDYADNTGVAVATLSDTGTAIAALTATQIGQLYATGFGSIDASDDALTLNVAQFQALGSVALTAADTVTITDTESNLEALTNAQFAAMVSNHVDVIHATNSTLNVSISQASALLGTSTHFASGDTVTLVDTGLSLSNLVSGRILQLAAAGIDTIDASDNFITFDLAQYNALGTVTLTQADTVTIQNDNNGISAMSVAEIKGLAASGVDVLESINGNFSFGAAQADALVNQTGGGHVALSTDDTFFVNDTAANVGALSLADIAAFGTLGAGAVDLIASGTLTINLAYYNAAVTAGVGIDAGDTVVLADTNANLRALTTTQLAALAGHGIDSIHATGGALILSIAQLNALGAVALTQTDTVTLTDTAANIQALTATQFTNFVTQGVDIFHSSSNALSLNASQVAAVIATAAVFTGSDTVTLSDSGSAIAALSATQIGELAGHGVDTIDASDNTLSINIAQFEALGSVQLSAGDTNTISDGFLNFLGMSLTDIGNLANQHISHLHSTDGVKGFDWSAARWAALPSGVTIDSTQGTVAMFDTAGAEQALTVTQINAYHTAGLNTILDSENASVLQFTVAQTAAILADGIQVHSFPTPAA